MNSSAGSIFRPSSETGDRTKLELGGKTQIILGMPSGGLKLFNKYENGQSADLTIAAFFNR